MNQTLKKIVVTMMMLVFLCEIPHCLRILSKEKSISKEGASKRGNARK